MIATSNSISWQFNLLPFFITLSTSKQNNPLLKKNNTEMQREEKSYKIYFNKSHDRLSSCFRLIDCVYYKNVIFV